MSLEKNTNKFFDNIKIVRGYLENDVKKISRDHPIVKKKVNAYLKDFNDTALEEKKKIFNLANSISRRKLNFEDIHNSNEKVQNKFQLYEKKIILMSRSLYYLDSFNEFLDEYHIPYYKYLEYIKAEIKSTKKIIENGVEQDSERVKVVKDYLVNFIDTKKNEFSETIKNVRAHIKELFHHSIREKDIKPELEKTKTSLFNYIRDSLNSFVSGLNNTYSIDIKDFNIVTLYLTLIDQIHERSAAIQGSYETMFVCTYGSTSSDRTDFDVTPYCNLLKDYANTFERHILNFKKQAQDLFNRKQESTRFYALGRELDSTFLTFDAEMGFISGFILSKAYKNGSYINMMNRNNRVVVSVNRHLESRGLPPIYPAEEKKKVAVNTVIGGLPLNLDINFRPISSPVKSTIKQRNSPQKKENLTGRKRPAPSNSPQNKKTKRS